MEDGTRFEALSRDVIGAAIRVHRELGPGLLESAYEACLDYELKDLGIPFQRQVPLPVVYRGVQIECCYRPDFIVGESLILELKSVDKLTSVHAAQMLTYLRLARCPVGLLINFNVEVLRSGIRRLVLRQGEG